MQKDKDKYKTINERTQARYTKRYMQYGHSPKTLGWNKGKQFERFHQLTSDWQLAGSRILDIGCGFGDYLQYLCQMGIEPACYTGIDVTQKLIDVAKETHQDRGNTSFICGDFLSFPFTDGVDYCFASGVFNFYNHEVDMYQYLLRGMQRMYELSDVAFSLDLISDKVDYKLEHTFHYNPARVLETAYGFSRNVMLKNNYFPFEFAVVVWKDDAFLKETTMYKSTANRLGNLLG